MAERWTGCQTITGHTQHLLARSHQLKRKLRETGAPSIRPPVTRRTFSFIHVKPMLMRMDPRVNQLHIQMPSRARRMICPRRKRGRRTFICEDGCLMKKI